VLTQLAPPGSLPDEAEFTYGPEHVHEAAVLIDAIHALHDRAVNAEQEAAELRKLLQGGGAGSPYRRRPIGAGCLQRP
jgi:hypothetical protein